MKAKLHPRGVIEFFGKIQQEQEKSSMPNMEGALSVLSTHPATDERIKNLNKLIEEKAGQGPYRKIDLDFDKFQEKLRNNLTQ